MCIMYYVLCVMCYVLCVMPYALCRIERVGGNDVDHTDRHLAMVRIGGRQTNADAEAWRRGQAQRPTPAAITHGRHWAIGAL